MSDSRGIDRVTLVCYTDVMPDTTDMRITMLPVETVANIGVSAENEVVTVAHLDPVTDNMLWVEVGPEAAVQVATWMRTGGSGLVGEGCDIGEGVDVIGAVRASHADGSSMVGLEVRSCGDCNRVTFTLIGGLQQVSVDLDAQTAAFVADSIYVAAVWSVTQGNPVWGVIDNGLGGAARGCVDLGIPGVYALTLLARAMSNHGVILP